MRGRANECLFTQYGKFQGIILTVNKKKVIQKEGPITRLSLLQNHDSYNITKFN